MGDNYAKIVQNNLKKLYVYRDHVIGDLGTLILSVKGDIKYYSALSCPNEFLDESYGKSCTGFQIDFLKMDKRR